MWPEANTISAEQWVEILGECGIFAQGDPRDWPAGGPCTSVPVRVGPCLRPHSGPSGGNR